MTGETRIVINPDPVQITYTGATNYQFVGSGDTTVSTTSTGNTTTVNIYTIATGATVQWGNVLGTLSNQTDLQTALDAKASQADFTGYTASTNSQIAYLSGVTSGNTTDISTLSSAIASIGNDVTGNTANIATLSAATSGISTTYVPITGTSGSLVSVVGNLGHQFRVDLSDSGVGEGGQFLLDNNYAYLQSAKSGNLNTVRLSGTVTDINKRIDLATGEEGNFTDETLINRLYADERYGSLSGQTGHTADISALQTFSANTYTMYDDIQDPSGFIDNQDIDVAYDHTTRTVTLTGTLTYYWNGEKKTLTSPWTSSGHTATEGKWYLYSTDGENFAWSQTGWQFYHVQVAELNYQTASADTYCFREVHGTMPWSTHRELHQVISSYRLSGGGAVDGSYTLDSDVDADKRPNFASAVIADEDLATTITQLTGATEGYSVMHVSGYTASVWNLANTNLFLDGGSYIYVNDPETGAMAAADKPRYVNVYQIMMPTTSDAGSQQYRMVFLQPQAEFLTLAAAEAEDVRGLYLGELTSTADEFVFYARLTFETGAAYSSAGKCVLTDITYLLGTKASSINAGNITTADHANLANLSWVSSGHIGGTANRIAGFNGGGTAELQNIVGSGDTTVSKVGTDFRVYSDISGKASQTDFTTHTGNTAIHFEMSGITGFTSSSDFNTYTGDTATALAAKADNVVNRISTGVNYTLSASSLNYIVEMTSTGNTTLTVPSGLTNDYQVTVVNYGGGEVTISAGSGVTLRSKDSNLKITDQYAAASIYQRSGTDEFLVIGDLTT